MSVYIPASTSKRMFLWALNSSKAFMTGLTTVLVKLIRASDLFVFDWNDSTWKSYGSATSPTHALTEVSAANWPGLYYFDFPSSAADGYLALIDQVSRTVDTLPASLDIIVGAMAAPGDAMALTSGERTTVQALVLSDATPFLGASVDAAVSSRAAPGAAMALTSGERTTVQALIVSDATPFPGARIDAAVSSRAIAGDAMALTPTERTAVQAKILSDATPFPGARVDAAISTRASQSSVDALPSASANAIAVVDQALSGHTTSGTAGEALSRVDAAVSSRASQSSVNALPSASSNATALLDAALSGHTSAGTAGEALGRVDAAVSSRAAPGAAMALTSSERTTVQALIVSDATPFLGARIDAAVSSRAAPGAAMALTSGERTTVQALIVSDATPFPGARIDAAITSRSTLTANQVDTQLSGAHGSGSWLTATGFPSAADIADEVWDELLADHHAAGSAGAGLALVDVAVSSRATAASVWAIAEGSPSSGTYGFAVVALRKWLRNKHVVDVVGGGREVVMDDDQTTPFMSFTLRGPNTESITLVPASPCIRGPAT